VPLNRWSLTPCSSQALDKWSLLPDNTHQGPDSVDGAVDYTGTQVNYYFICKRKLWLFSRGLEMEETSDLVLMGRLLHERGYQRKRKEIQVGRIKIDFVGPSCEIHEVKRSRKAEDAHLFQLLYYLYYLKQYADIQGRGILHYPLVKRTVDVELTDERIKQVESILREIHEILRQQCPPKPVKIGYCRKCSYSEFCWGSE
jgi:CRISPR-associated exonuclease Cas4